MVEIEKIESRAFMERGKVRNSNMEKQLNFRYAVDTHWRYHVSSCV